MDKLKINKNPVTTITKLPATFTGYKSFQID